MAKLAIASSFTTDTAKKTGESERMVRRRAERGEKIAADVQIAHSQLALPPPDSENVVDFDAMAAKFGNAAK